MVYDFKCESCDETFGVTMSVDQAGSFVSCPLCGAGMRRLYYPPALLNRQKPGSFSKKEKATWNAMDSRLAALRLAEEKGAEAQREARKNFGITYNQIMQYKKEKYAN